ncbi:MAG TPA: carbohydrate-binding family 9-like protein, partial [Candidatus Eisenbacteria bacterium]|nr:carbohydrate-binding family 9-like protein [Candidatus Eisenbacteria bacterium]
MNLKQLLFLLCAGALSTATCAPAASFLDDWARMKSIIPQGYVCYHATDKITIDGRLDEASWQAAPWTQEFVDIEGDAKPKPRFRTRAKMLWDDEYFYVAAELEEPHVWATLTNHDAVIFHDNDFEVFIDPDGDSHDYYEFEMNALNTGWDLLLKKRYIDGGPALNSWEIPGLKTAVHVDGTLNHPADRDKGWSVEIAFPWKALAEYAHRKSPPAEGDQWRVAFSRVEWQIEIKDGKYHKVPGAKEDNWIWSAQGIIDMHRPEKWGYVQFTRKKFGQTKFVPDPAGPARNALEEIYYAQQDFQAKHQRWAATLE